MIKVTINRDILPGDTSSIPSLEYLGKHDPTEQLKVLENHAKAQQEKLDNLSDLSEKVANKQISKDQFEEKKAEIEKNLASSFHKSPSPLIVHGKNGLVSTKHKNKLAFMFVGDTQKADESKKYNINNPKICIAVGGSLEAAYDPKKKEYAKIDPRKDFIPQASAQLHLISSTNVDVGGIIPTSKLKNRSSIKAEADVLELYSKEAVIIRSFGRPYLSSGAKSLTPGGIHLVSGIGAKEPQPMVLGKNLMDFQISLVTTINELVSTIIKINTELIDLKIALAVHVHEPSPLVSVGLASHVVKTLITKDLFNTGNLYSLLFNFEIKKLMNLMALSPNKFISDYNRVN